MTLDEMKEACGDGTGQVTLVLSRLSRNGYLIRLTPRSGPVGMVMCTNGNGKTVARFDCKAVLRWIDKQKQIQLAE